MQFSTCLCFLNRDVFNGTLMTNSSLVLVHVLHTCHHLMVYYSLLRTAISTVPYLPSSLASASFSFHYCLHSLVHPFPSHGICSQGAQAVVSALVDPSLGKLLSSSSGSLRALRHRSLELLQPRRRMNMCSC